MKHLKKFENFSLTGIVPMNEEVTTVGGIDVDQLAFGLFTQQESNNFIKSEQRVEALRILNKQFVPGSDMGKKWAELVDYISQTAPVSSSMKSPKSEDLGLRTHYFELLDMMKEKPDPLTVKNLKLFMTQFAKKAGLVKDESGKLIMVAGSKAPSAAKESYNFRG